MPVINYQKALISTRKHALENPAISQKNRDLLARFLNAYEVKPAREMVFLAQIERFLKKTDDFERDMHNPEIINSIFKRLKEEPTLDKQGRPRNKPLSPATIETCKNVSKKFARWLNNNTTPAGFKDVKSIKKNMRRHLEPSDMVEWEEGLAIAQQTNSLQIKAALLTQLDAGFRPSEFIDLNYGDVEVLDDSVVFHIKDGKTGARAVPCFRCVPYFLRWYDNHPSKKKESPLWVLESVKRSHRTVAEAAQKVERYSYRTIQYRFDLMFAKAGIDKPSDFYNLRHSSCRLDRLDNVPNDLAASRHGHSIDFYINTYGRFSLEDTMQRLRSVYGKVQVKRTLLVNEACPRCKQVNEPEAEYCRVCGTPLSAETAAKSFQQKQAVEEKLASMEQMLTMLLKSDPRYKKAKALIRKEKVPR